MQIFRRLLAALFLFLVFITSVDFSLQNTAQVPSTYGFLGFSPQFLTLWVVSAFALGGLLRLIFAVGVSNYFKNKTEKRRLRKQLKLAESALSELRRTPAKSLI